MVIWNTMTTRVYVGSFGKATLDTTVMFSQASLHAQCSRLLTMASLPQSCRHPPPPENGASTGPQRIRTGTWQAATVYRYSIPWATLWWTQLWLLDILRALHLATVRSIWRLEWSHKIQGRRSIMFVAYLGGRQLKIGNTKFRRAPTSVTSLSSHTSAFDFVYSSVELKHQASAGQKFRVLAQQQGWAHVWSWISALVPGRWEVEN